MVPFWVMKTNCSPLNDWKCSLPPLLQHGLKTRTKTKCCKILETVMRHLGPPHAALCVPWRNEERWWWGPPHGCSDDIFCVSTFKEHIFTFLLDRCNIPLATSLAILVLSMWEKYTFFPSTLIYGFSLFFLSWFNKQPFSANRTTTNIDSSYDQTWKCLEITIKTNNI